MTWYFGMKVHTGTDQRGFVHSRTTTHGGEADITQLPYLLHGAERELFGDQAYWAEPDRRAAAAAGIRYRVNRRPTKQHPLTERWKRINRARSRIRACGEHAYHVVKHLWGFTLPGPGEEHGLGVRRVRLGESVFGTETAAAGRGDVSSLAPHA